MNLWQRHGNDNSRNLGTADLEVLRISSNKQISKSFINLSLAFQKVVLKEKLTYFFYFYTSFLHFFVVPQKVLRRLLSFHKAFWSTTKKCEDKLMYWCFLSLVFSFPLETEFQTAQTLHLEVDVWSLKPLT